MLRHKIRLTLISLLLFLSLLGNAQYVTIPDPVFLSYLNSSGLSSCLNGNQLDTTCQGVTSKIIIDITNNQQINDLTGITYFDNLKILRCKSTNLNLLPQLPLTLTELSCENTDLQVLPALPPSLKTLNCSNTPIVMLPALSDSLVRLECSNIGLTVMPSLPSKLNYLNCNNNQLTNFPTLPSSLSTIYCSYNVISTFPALPAELRLLMCDNNLLTTLPILPSKLGNLKCYNNLLTSIPNFPDSLTYVDCHTNQLTSLPSLPDTLSQLTCANNLLTSLPAINNSLFSLNSDYNQLQSLPFLPESIKHVSCKYNQLSTITSLPDSVYTLDIIGNPDLTCLPHVQYINNFKWAQTGIECLPNSISINYSAPSVALTPVCDYFNNNNCEIFWNISGSIYNDTNTNCINDSVESLYKKVKVKLYKDGNLVQQCISDLFGRYTFDADTGSYLITPDSSSIFNVQCPLSGVLNSNLSVADSLDDNMDFALGCKPGFDIGISALIQNSGVFRPADAVQLQLLGGDLSNQFGLHCASGISGEIKIRIAGPAIYISPASGSLTPTLSGDTLIYTISDFGNVDYYSAFRFNILVDTFSQNLQNVCFESWATLLNGDNDSTNNYFTRCFNIVNSFDPNDKSVDKIYINNPDGEWLTYTIRFQNTGTAEAINIYILDTLSSNVDEGSFQLLSYSHEPFIQIANKAIRFQFSNIHLPDSNNYEPGSHGYVTYRVKSLAGLPYNTEVKNKAFIYFDYNPPVITNEATSVVRCIENKYINEAICYGDQYNFNNINLKLSGTYLDTISNPNGCDTIIYLNLTVTHQAINVTQTINYISIQNPGNYQWYNCATHSIISGQTANTFTPNSSGNYAVILSNGNCRDTSSCINFTITNINDINTKTLSISPNPVTKMLNVENIPEEASEIHLYDFNGKKILAFLLNNRTTKQIDVSDLPNGVYHLEISEQSKISRIRFVKF